MNSDSLFSEEMEVLQSIYMDELIIGEQSNKLAEISITIHPNTAGDESGKYVCMTLHFYLTFSPLSSSSYPNKEPIMTIRNPRGLSDSHLESIEENLKSLASSMIGDSMIFSLIEYAKETLTNNNRPHCCCPICLEKFHENDAFFRTQCYHYFHVSCIKGYIQVAASQICPVCREDFDIEVSLLESAPDYKDIQVPETELEMDECYQEWRKQCRILFERQRKKGGIIDLEFEKNRYLITSNDVPHYEDESISSNVKEGTIDIEGGIVSTTAPHDAFQSDYVEQTVKELDVFSLYENQTSPFNIHQLETDVKEPRTLYNETDERKQKTMYTVNYVDNNRQYYSNSPKREHYKPKPHYNSSKRDYSEPKQDYREKKHDNEQKPDSSGNRRGQYGYNKGFSNSRTLQCKDRNLDNKTKDCRAGERRKSRNPKNYNGKTNRDEGNPCHELDFAAKEKEIITEMNDNASVRHSMDNKVKTNTDGDQCEKFECKSIGNNSEASGKASVVTELKCANESSLNDNEAHIVDPSVSKVKTKSGKSEQGRFNTDNNWDNKGLVTDSIISQGKFNADKTQWRKSDREYRQGRQQKGKQRNFQKNWREVDNENYPRNSNAGKNDPHLLYRGYSGPKSDTFRAPASPIDQNDNLQYTGNIDRLGTSCDYLKNHTRYSQENPSSNIDSKNYKINPKVSPPEFNCDSISCSNTDTSTSLLNTCEKSDCTLNERVVLTNVHEERDNGNNVASDPAHNNLRNKRRRRRKPPKKTNTSNLSTDTTPHNNDMIGSKGPFRNTTDGFAKTDKSKQAYDTESSSKSKAHKSHLQHSSGNKKGERNVSSYTEYQKISEKPMRAPSEFITHDDTG